MATTPTIQCPAPTLHAGTQGLAKVSVNDSAAQLLVSFLLPLTNPQKSYLTNPLSYSLTGGQRIFPRIRNAVVQANNQDILLTLDNIGDFSVYTLGVSGPDIDPFFSGIKLLFRLACDDSFDCAQSSSQQAVQAQLPVLIDYLAKDYSGFRQALLDFIPTRLPEWTERSEADLGIMLLELFAATADNLSYMQDRVANEAFLATATQRRSVASHLALIGYQMDEGASAYTWLQFQVNTIQTLASGFQVSDNPGSTNDPVLVFETLGPARLDPALNQIALFNWGNTNCCLPVTALSATLAGSFPGLNAGDYLLFDNGKGCSDVVRLTAAPQINSAPFSTTSPAFITIVNWSPATPLHHDYCLTTSIARGNIVVATHGETVTETLRSLTDEQKIEVNAEIAAQPPSVKRPRQRLRLGYAPLARLDAPTAALGQPLQPSENSTFDPSTREFRSISTLQLRVDGVPWQETLSLLTHQADDSVFRLETDDRGDATVVFGDGIFGLQPSETSAVVATYRVGGGAIGNVGPNALMMVHSQLPTSWLVSVTNPLAARGGRDLESGEHARSVAPATFRDPLVAVTEADYEDATMTLLDDDGQPLIQRAKARFQWTGSWLTVTLTVDPLNTETVTPDLQQRLQNHLNARRLAGYDLQIVAPSFVPVDLQFQFVPSEGSQSAMVKQALLQAFSSSNLEGGGKGFFHPDNFSFGDRLFISRIYAAVMSVAGVKSAQIIRLARAHSAKPDLETDLNLVQGFLSVGTDQVIRLDNDRNFPQNGTLSITVAGGAA